MHLRYRLQHAGLENGDFTLKKHQMFSIYITKRNIHRRQKILSAPLRVRSIKWLSRRDVIVLENKTSIVKIIFRPN